MTKRVLLIGWDAADWRVIDPLLSQGKMPALQRLIARGVRGNIATLHPVLSPMLWTSIATGKRPFKHGIHGFTEPTPDGKGVRAVTGLSRKTKAIWNILNQQGKRPIVVGWWPSHPAEPIDGVMVSNFYQRAPQRPPRDGADPWPMAPGTVHPQRLAEHLREFRFHLRELSEEHLLPFVPLGAKVDQDKDERLANLAKTLCETTSIQGAATALMQLEEWDFLGAYYDGIDHFCHGFMRYHPPKQDWITDEDFELYSGVIEAAYRFHDMMLGTLLQLAGEDTTVILISDHGFHPDHLRPRSIPVEPAGPAIEHRDLGIFVMAGPGVRKGETVYGTSVLDVCPTVLTLFDLPVGLDMDGKPQITALVDPPHVRHIPTWDEVAGDDAMHPDESRIDAVGDAEAMRQLIDLGYIEEPSGDAEQAVRECVRELRYNLAQSYMDAMLHGPAATILESLWNDWPDEHRFGQNLIMCYAGIGETQRRAEAIDLLEERARDAAQRARKDLEAIEPELKKYKEKSDAGEDVEIPRPLQQNVRKLSSLAADRSALIEWLRATQAMWEGDADRALALLEPLVAEEHHNPTFHNQIGGTYLRLRRHEEAARAFERALEHDSESVEATLGLAEARAGLRDWQGVIDASLGAAELVFFNPKAHTLLGRALLRTGEHEASEKALHVAITQAPLYAAAHRTLAVLYARHLVDPSRSRAHRETARQIRMSASIDRSVQRKAFRGERLFQSERTYSRAVPAPFDPADEPPVVTVVSGLPRSGTSMMMQMLEAGGIRPFTDSSRTADDSNARGYYEHERVLQLLRDNAWVPDVAGRAMKVVAPLLPALPKTARFNVVFMERDIRDIVLSQRAMLDRLDKTGATLGDDRLAEILDKHLRAADAWAHARPGVRVLHLSYDETVEDPVSSAKRLAEFFAGGFDAQAAAVAVDRSLKHI